MNLKLETIIQNWKESADLDINTENGLAQMNQAKGKVEAFEKVLTLLNNQQSTELSIGGVVGASAEQLVCPNCRSKNINIIDVVSYKCNDCGVRVN